MTQFPDRNAFILRAIILLFCVALLSFTKTLERIDYVFYDKATSMRHYPVSNDIVIVAIDEESLQVLGRWPWSRRIHADFINRLANNDSVIALDLLFTESDENDPQADDILAAAIINHGNVVLPVAPIFDVSQAALVLAEPLPSLRKYANLGHVDIELDQDGLARRVFLAAGIFTPQWPAFGLALANQANKLEEIDRLSYLRNDDVHRHSGWVRSHEVLIPYIGPPGSFKQISYAQILYDESVVADLRGKTIIVGMTAAGMGTRFATPVSLVNRQPMSGVEWHANVFEMLQNDRAIFPASNLIASLISVLWVMAILLGISFFRRELTFPLLTAIFISGMFIMSASLWWWHIWVPPSAALFGTMAIYPLWNWRRVNEFMRSLFVARARSNAALESVEEGVVTTDANDRIIYMNSGAEKILEVKLKKVQGSSLHQIFDFKTTQESTYTELSGSDLPVPEFSVSTIQCYLETKKGGRRAVRVTRHLLRDDKGELMGYVVAIADVTDTVELTRQVAHQASHDALTKLPNRALLLTRFDQMAVEVKQVDGVMAVFFVTLDNFKKINDALGHRAGDILLRMVSWRLYEVIRVNDMAARWGGDEFVLLFDYLQKDDTAPQMAQKILKIIEQPFELDNHEVFVTASIGISFYPQDGERGEEVLEKAGTAMYRVKHEGGNSFGFYSPESSMVWTRDQLEFEKELRAALNNGLLHVLYQPIVDVSQRCIVRMEALIRWQHPTRGFLSPSDFIPLAEDIGLIEQLGAFVLQTACIDAREIAHQTGHSINVSVNVNPRQLLSGHFVDTVSQILRDTELPASALILEITESAIVSDIVYAAEILNQIKSLGVSIALDDFGTGYSSLTLLRELPIDILKIDKSFIRTLGENSNDLTITQAMIGLGKNLGLLIIAEGVETEQQVKILVDHQCYVHQGYYFSRPV
ncbi:MAG: EAL domain-containing protein, partial [Nitrosomonas sp.]|nr:EAL domain-containing protein [Nitrosomonas sp.]